jgi:Mg2+/Co2+ transporter CorB
MSNTPYNSPETTSYQAADPARQSVRLVAKYQRWVIFALLGNIVANILAFAAVGQDLPVRLIAIVLSLAVAVFAMVAIFLLAKQIIGTAVGVLCAILMTAPCISLIVLLVVNQKATSYLQKNGVRVGFLGADPNSI